MSSLKGYCAACQKACLCCGPQPGLLVTVTSHRGKGKKKQAPSGQLELKLVGGVASLSATMARNGHRFHSGLCAIY